jgi:IS30 family transposase
MKYHRLSTEERYELAALRRQNLGMGQMAKHLGRHRSTLYREVKRNQSVHDGRYRANQAVEKASGRQRPSGGRTRSGRALKSCARVLTTQRSWRIQSLMPVKRRNSRLPAEFLLNASGQRLLIWEPQCLWRWHEII